MSYEQARHVALEQRPTWEIFSMSFMEIPTSLDYAATSKAWGVILHKECREHLGQAGNVPVVVPAEWTAHFYQMYVVILAEKGTFLLPAIRQDKPGGLGFAVEFPSHL